MDRRRGELTAMRHRSVLPALAILCGCLAPAPAAAQSPRFTIAVNGGYQPSTTSFDDRFTFDLNRETATTDVSYPVDAGPLFDGGVGIRLWKGLGAGLAFTRFSVDGEVEVTAALPHPLFFQRNRDVSGESDGLTRSESGVHIQAQYHLPPFGQLQVVLSGGPSILDIKQSLVTGVNYTEEFPYDTTSFVGVDSRQVAGTATGFNVGADFQWLFTHHVGVGGLLRFTRAKVDLEVDSRTVQVDAGGFQVGGGLRLAF
jgi:Outer membrane protein beta-barrel domain